MYRNGEFLIRITPHKIYVLFHHFARISWLVEISTYGKNHTRMIARSIDEILWAHLIAIVPKYTSIQHERVFRNQSHYLMDRAVILAVVFDRLRGYGEGKSSMKKGRISIASIAFVMTDVQATLVIIPKVKLNELDFRRVKKMIEFCPRVRPVYPSNVTWTVHLKKVEHRPHSLSVNNIDLSWRFEESM